MNALTPRIIGTGVLFIFVFLSGLWLSNLGRPINVVVLTIHKLIGLGTAILIAVTIHQANQAIGLSAAVWVVAAITLVLFLATIITGGLLSTDRPAATIIATLHKVGPFLTVVSTAVTMYFLVNHQS
jgi:hypothetical protein